MAYHLVTVVAQCTAGRDGLWRRRETSDVIQSLLNEARAHGFRLILDIQPGHSAVAAEVQALVPFLMVDVVLNMDGFGSQSLKLSSYRAVMRRPLAFAGIKLFYKQDVTLFSPAQILALTPQPAVVIYQ